MWVMTKGLWYPMVVTGPINVGLMLPVDPLWMMGPVLQFPTPTGDYWLCCGTGSVSSSKCVGLLGKLTDNLCMGGKI